MRTHTGRDSPPARLETKLIKALNTVSVNHTRELGLARRLHETLRAGSLYERRSQGEAPTLHILTTCVLRSQ